MPDTDESGSVIMHDFGDNVDNVTFGQILEMDESEEHDFSKPLVFNFFEQADDTFAKIDKLLLSRDEGRLKELSNLGHFLKGSSATLGFNKLRDCCQVIQQYGKHLKLDGTAEPDDAVCVEKIEEALAKAKESMEELQRLMRTFFNVDPKPT